MPEKLYAQADINHPESSGSAAEGPGKKKFDFILRFGEGGFRDSRSPVHQLGGGQLALDIRPVALPVAFSIASESYTNSPDPTHAYEISKLLSLNLLYITPLSSNEKLNYFFGGGIGWLEVPTDENNPGARTKDNLYNLEAGVHYRYFQKVGFYGLVKYLNSKKTVNNIQVIDFSERIFLLGITYSFSL
ncbi:MAG: hypothetical protein OQK76_12230 [Gammaproteobacteria bacterium]|nr:hypothetical protein [Gammaproteobacteria bacterium]MCW8911372.1 hypothetical protein [Gammaproteobacteria bacterium]MCW9004103.1 hypothetical protein [Gammaproteobacteria bacterium]MCW9056010.1 hypothetical protein [Gammaproteobacteria bacterium]